MPTLPKNLSDYVRRTLAKKGVEVMTSTRVMSCAAHGVEFEHGRLDADTIIWAAGVVASPAARWLDAQHDRAGRGEGRRRSLSALWDYVTFQRGARLITEVPPEVSRAPTGC